MKSVCASVVRYSLASSACLCLATVRPGAVMSTGSPRTQTACVIPGWPSPSPATVSSAISVLRVPFTRSAVALESRRVDAASPRGDYYYYSVPLRKRGGPFPPHLFIGSRRKLRPGGKKKKKTKPQPRRAAMRQTGRRCQSREQGGEKCVSPSPRSTPHPRKMKMLEVKNTAWLHARISWGGGGDARVSCGRRSGAHGWWIINNQSDSQAVVFSE